MDVLLISKSEILITSTTSILRYWFGFLSKKMMLFTPITCISICVAISAEMCEGLDLKELKLKQ